MRTLMRVMLRVQGLDPDDIEEKLRRTSEEIQRMDEAKERRDRERRDAEREAHKRYLETVFRARGGR